MVVDLCNEGKRTNERVSRRRGVSLHAVFLLQDNNKNNIAKNKSAKREEKKERAKICQSDSVYICICENARAYSVSLRSETHTHKIQLNLSSKRIKMTVQMALKIWFLCKI